MPKILLNLWELLEMIKIGHSVLALPFAFMGAMLAARGWPGGRISFFILLAMVAARSAAMAFNRLADASFDALNPRTSGRSLPQGRLKEGAVLLFVIVNSLVFIWAAAQLNLWDLAAEQQIPLDRAVPRLAAADLVLEMPGHETHVL